MLRRRDHTVASGGRWFPGRTGTCSTTTRIRSGSLGGSRQACSSRCRSGAAALVAQRSATSPSRAGNTPTWSSDAAGPRDRVQPGRHGHDHLLHRRHRAQLHDQRRPLPHRPQAPSPASPSRITSGPSRTAEFDIRCMLAIDERCQREMRGKLIVQGEDRSIELTIYRSISGGRSWTRLAPSFPLDRSPGLPPLRERSRSTTVGWRWKNQRVRREGRSSARWRAASRLSAV